MHIIKAERQPPFASSKLTGLLLRTSPVQSKKGPSLCASTGMVLFPLGGGCRSAYQPINQSYNEKGKITTFSNVFHLA